MSNSTERQEGNVPVSAIQDTHKLLLEALRHREQEIIQFLAILVPAIAGFGWLLKYANDNKTLFIGGTVGVLLLLFLGALYSLALGYNFRYIILQLAKIEVRLGLNEWMLQAWPRKPREFIDRYKLRGRPWCTPPEIIRVFWIIFILTIAGVLIAGSFAQPELITWLIIIPASLLFIALAGYCGPKYYGYKLRKQAMRELIAEKAGAWKKI